jgi:hypothetical protein
MRGFAFGVPSMNDSLEVEILLQLDGGESMAKCKGVVG